MNRERIVRYACFLIAIAAGASWIVPGAASAQTPPFFAAGGTSFTPEIGVVNSGVINDVQAVVSADQKYVTLTMRPANSALLSLQNFTFQNGGSLLGFVGSNGGNAGANGNQIVRAGGQNPRGSGVNDDYPDGRPTIHSVLDRTGMIRVDLLSKQ